MKKILLLFLVYLIVTIPSSAAITPEEAVSQQYIENHGYSTEMARLVNLQNAQINGGQSKYKDNAPSWYTENRAVRWIRNTFMYIDPSLDNEKFMQHDIKYSNNFYDH